ncbi:hypothetical protein FIBSPDRAFT_858669 [Athelia psychrophila]|uniref:Extracellular membrane protein CFEM domain-containing protein n=1 Tax=Athelia psychrophila TaxID=1759441 RepID=A0A165Z8I0_9AGAM|nr:hypothetical protein FIBSPDRAFT_872813 [Fibularhizoctonia sp. CBS 109695]KZP23118.1 hypothetical protein FIBSPDRAFT_858669 [Fibularhizoctonia sp. CBS 109695]
MVAFTSLAVISLGFLAAQTISPADAIASLGRRQPGISPSDLPAACQSGCTTILTTITSCNSNITSGLACICTSANVASLQSCVNCIVSSSSLSAAEAEEGSSLIKSFNAECVGKGIASLTVSSASASATGSTTGSAAGAAGTSSPLKVKGAAGANAGLGMVGLAGLAAVGFAATWL